MAYSKQNFQDGQILTAANLEKMEDGIIAGQGAGAYNLLDNSDFRNPVNSLGRSGTYEGVKNFYTFVIDRWKTYSNKCAYTLSSAGLQIDNLDPNSQAGPQEEVSNPKRMKGKTYTLAVGYDDGNVVCGNVKVPTRTLTSDQYLNAVVGSYTRPGLRLLIKSDYSLIEFQILISVGQRVTLKWAALYEGSYTADTLPAYQPKDKHVEMLNCGVPLAPHNILDNSDFIHPVNQRGKTSYTANGYTIDRWSDTSNATTMVTEKGLELRNHSADSDAYWRQRIPANALTSGKAYTMAVNVEGQVYCGYAVIDSTATATFYGSNRLSLSCTGLTNSYWTIQITIPAKKTIGPFLWAALYEGAYTVDTLPSYVPKGKHIEMLNCGVPFAPHNLLDNSDFSNPVNQLGLTSFTPTGQKNLDRWDANLGNNSTITVGNGKITISESTSGSYFKQIIPVDLTGKMMTYAVKTANGITCKSAIISSSSSLAQIDGVNAYLGVYASSGKTIFQIYFNTSDSITLDLYWAALYEGSYTADTLPPYVPKGKHVEMLNCGVPLASHNLLDNSDFRNPIAQAGLNGMHGSTKYVCDRWISQDADATFGGDYIRPGSPIDQRLSKTVIDINKTYTVAICYSDGRIRAESGTFSNGFGSQTLGIYCMKKENSTDYVTVRLNKGITTRWVALYEGSYTAETLPAYQPKGYAVELAECKRYYYQSWVGSEFDKGYITREAMSTNTLSLIEFPTEMRIVPTITFYISVIDAGIVKEWTTNSSVSVTQNYTSTKAFSVKSGDNFTVGKTYYFHYSASADL